MLVPFTSINFSNVKAQEYGSYDYDDDDNGKDDDDDDNTKSASPLSNTTSAPDIEDFEYKKRIIP